MANSQRSKEKILRLYQIFCRETDIDNPLTTAQLAERLENYGISAERKSVYNDIKTIIDCGVDIQVVRTKSTAYYLAGRTFQLAELMLLADAVINARFISGEQANSFIERIAALTSQYHGELIKQKKLILKRIRSEFADSNGGKSTPITEILFRNCSSTDAVNDVAKIIGGKFISNENSILLRTEKPLRREHFNLLLGFGGNVKILSPKSVQDEFVDYMRSIIKQYI